LGALGLGAQGGGGQVGDLGYTTGAMQHRNHWTPSQRFRLQRGFVHGQPLFF